MVTFFARADQHAARKRGQLWARETDTVKKEPLSSYAPNPTHDQYLTLGLFRVKGEWAIGRNVKAFHREVSL